MQDIAIGIAVDVSDPVRAQRALALAGQAETDGLDLVVLTSTDRYDSTVSGIDVWTAATWVLASTQATLAAMHHESTPGEVGVLCAGAADTPEALWALLIEGRDAIEAFPTDPLHLGILVKDLRRRYAS